MPITPQPGDILCWRVAPGADWVARLIGWGERVLRQPGDRNHQYYHVGYVSLNPQFYYESTWPRIARTPVPNPLPDYIEIHRLTIPPTVEQMELIDGYAETQVGRLYNLVGVLTGGYIQIGSFPFCSQFVWQCFTQAGILICHWMMLESPNDLASSVPLVSEPTPKAA